MWLAMELIWGVFLLFVGLYDLKNHYITRGQIIVAAAIFLGGLAMFEVEWKVLLFGVLIGGSMFIISRITCEALGSGDCWIILFLAMSLGTAKSLGVLFVSFLLSAIFGVLYMLLSVKKWNKERELPFIPFLFLGYTIDFSNKYKGIYTIELACVMPIIILLLSGIIVSSFYLHDKNIMYSKIYEVGNVAKQEYREPSEFDIAELELVLEEACKGKLLLFNNVDCDIEESGDSITVKATTQWRGKTLSASRKFEFVNAEKSIRSIKRIE